METANIVRSARVAAGYSQDTLAKACGLAKRTIQNVEAGRAPSHETVLALRAVLGDAIPSFSEIRPDVDQADDPDVFTAAAVAVQVKGEEIWREKNRYSVHVWTVLILSVVGIFSTVASAYGMRAEVMYCLLAVFGVMPFAAILLDLMRMNRLEKVGFASMTAEAETVLHGVSEGSMRRIGHQAFRDVARVVGTTRLDAAFMSPHCRCRVG